MPNSDAERAMTYSNVAVFLGAGASHPFGVPTMKGMVSQVSEPAATLSPNERELLERLTKRLTAYYARNYDLEKLLDVIHDLSDGRPSQDALGDLAPRALYRFKEVLEACAPNSFEGEKQADQELLADAETAGSLETHITDRISQWCGAADFSAAQTAYSAMFNVLNYYLNNRGLQEQIERDYIDGIFVPRASFATTNYDECLDNTFRRLRVPVYTGFYPNVATRQTEFVISSESPEPPEPRERRAPFDRGSITRLLLKIHGSVSWWRTSTGRVVELASATRGQVLGDGATLVRREMNYPVATKDLVGTPYNILYAWLAEALANASLWLFIGYSFGDISVVQMMNELLGSKTKFIVVGPHADSVVKGSLPDRLSERAIAVDAKFGKPEMLTLLSDAMMRKP